MRTLAFALVLTLVGCADAGQLVRDTVGSTSSGTSGGSTSGWPVAAATYAVDATGTWTTNWGTMTLRQLDDGRVTGTYSEDGGSRIDAQVTNNVIEGYWIEPTSVRECSTARGGSRHWGRIQYVLVSQDRFVGKYGYCNDAIAYANDDWNGTRVR